MLNKLSLFDLLHFIVHFTKLYFDNVLNFQNGIREHVVHRAFATLQIELYRVVDYDSKWSTKFHEDCIFDFFFKFHF